MSTFKFKRTLYEAVQFGLIAATVLIPFLYVKFAGQIDIHPMSFALLAFINGAAGWLWFNYLFYTTDGRYVRLRWEIKRELKQKNLLKNQSSKKS